MKQPDEKKQRETVERLGRLMWVLSEPARVVGLDEVCLIDLYRQEIEEADGLRLATMAALAKCRLKWGRNGSLAKREDRARRYAARVLETPWARAEMLRAWAKCAKAVEEANRAHGLKVGRPGWASHAEVEHAMKEAGL